MPTKRRHGLPTLLMTGSPDKPGTLTDHLLAGRKTVVVRPVTDPNEEPLERVGDRVLLVDAAGLSIAVADVASTTMTTLADVDALTCRADDPDQISVLHWGRAQLARWRMAGLLGPGATVDGPVVVIGIRVVGLEAHADTPDTGETLP